MPIKVVSVSELLDKSIFAGKNQRINIRSGAGTYSKVLTTIEPGERVGKVATWVTSGRDAKGDRDGSLWLQLYEKYGNASGFGAWVKMMPGAFSWKELKQQGAKTEEEKAKEKEEKDKTLTDKIFEAVKWLGIGYVAVELIKTSGTKNGKRK